MVTFQYKAIDKDGKPTKGVIRAQDQMAAVAKIKETCPVITSITPIQERDSHSVLSMEIGRKPKIKSDALSVMCSQFSIMLKAGMPVSRSVEMIANQTEDKRLKKILSDIAEDVAGGSTVASAFEKNGQGVFPVTFIETIRAGEESGTLEHSFARMELYYKKASKNKEKLQRATTYPIFVVLVAVVVLIVVMAKVIPTLANVFSSLGGNLPVMTQMMIGMSNFFAKWWILILAVIAAVVIALAVYFRTEKGAMVKGRLLLKMPGIGKINLMMGSAQFANTMSVMLSSGLTVNNAIKVTANIMDNAVLSREVSEMQGKVEAGRSLRDCILAVEDFPENLKQMVGVGEETGDLDETLEVIGEYYENEADHLTAQALNKLEPTILIFLAIFAGFIVISIYLPMFTMYNLF